MIENLLKNPALVSLIAIFTFIFGNTKEHSRSKLIWYAVSILALSTCRSVFYMFNHFILKYATFKKSSLYNTINNTKIELDWFSKKLIQLALKAVGTDEFVLRAIIDDTLVAKFGLKIELVKKLFDHAQHNGSNYLTGHCFVGLVLLIPVKFKDQYIYIRVPITFRLWRPDSKITKIQIAKQLFEQLITVVDGRYTICLMFDSWYVSKEILSLLNNYNNVEAQFSAKSNMCLYDLPQTSDGDKKRGRPRKYGKKITISDFDLKDVPGTNYSAGSRTVITRVMGSLRQVTATVTFNKDSQTYRLFICTDPQKCHIETEMLNNKVAKAMAKDPELNAVAGSYMRWQIETTFQEQKAFWGLEEYMLRSAAGIERLINLQLIVYAVLSVLPWLVKDFAYLADLSIQERRFEVGRLIERDLFFSSFRRHLETKQKYDLASEVEKYAQGNTSFGDTGT